VNERIDEQIGALLEGRVDEPRRGELLAHLAAAGDDYLVFADTAGVLREAEGDLSEDVPEVDLEEVEAPGSTPVIPLRAGEAASEAVAPGEREAETPRTAPVIPLRPRRAAAWRSPAVRALAAAAVVAAIAVVPVLRSRANGGGWGDPARLAVLVTSAGAPVPPRTDHPWRVTRGGEISARETGIAARVGTLHTDIAIAASPAAVVDTALVVQFANQAANTLNGANLSGSGGVVADYQEIADSTHWSGATLLERLATARRHVIGLVDEDYFAAGAWTEAARVAALRENAAFFRTPESRRAVDKMNGLEGLSDEGKAAAIGIRNLIEDGRETQDWTSLQQRLDALLRALAD
jgi:hypothetical protein